MKRQTRRAVSLAVAIALFPVGAAAEMTTALLKERCSALTFGKSFDMLKASGCANFLRGFMEGILIAQEVGKVGDKNKIFCLPDQSMKTNPIVVANWYIKFLDEHPALIKEDAQASLSGALGRFFPCLEPRTALPERAR